MSSKSRNRNRKTRPAIELARAAVRLAHDGPLEPVAELRGLLACSAPGMVRRIREGVRGVYLDGVRDGIRGWLTTRAAVERFRRAYAEKCGESGDRT